MTPLSDSRVPVARIGAAHGIKGEVRAQVYLADPLTIGDYEHLHDRSGRTFAVARARLSGSSAILKFVGIDDRSAAEALNGTELHVSRSHLPADELDEDEYFFSDLEGLEARDDEGHRHGVVVAVHDFGAGIVLELDPGNGKTIMIPFSKAAVPEVDLDARTLTLDARAAGLADTKDEA